MRKKVPGIKKINHNYMIFYMTEYVMPVTNKLVAGLTFFFSNALFLKYERQKTPFKLFFKVSSVVKPRLLAFSIIRHMKKGLDRPQIIGYRPLLVACSVIC